jgi:hypothetical protein
MSKTAAYAVQDAPTQMIKTRGYAAQSATTPLGPFDFERREPGPHDVQIEILYFK